MHLGEVLALSRDTKRTLVLPNVNYGYMGSGNKFYRPLCLYFDLKVIGEYVPWVSEDYFFSRVNSFVRANHTPSMHAIWIRPPETDWEPVRLLFGLISSI